MTVLSDKCISYYQVVTLYIYGHCYCIWQMERRWILPLLLGHHSKSKINFPYWNVSPNSGGAVFVYRWAILLAAEWSCTCLCAWSFRVMPKSFNCFWNIFFNNPFTFISCVCCLERISKRPTWKLIFFSVKLYGFLSYLLYRKHVTFFSTSTAVGTSFCH